MPPEIRATEVAPTHEGKVKCSSIYANLNNCQTGSKAFGVQRDPLTLNSQSDKGWGGVTRLNFLENNIRY